MANWVPVGSSPEDGAIDWLNLDTKERRWGGPTAPVDLNDGLWRSGWDANTIPQGGFTLGQLLGPNYMPNKEGLDPNNLEGSFAALQPNFNLREALAAVAPGAASAGWLNGPITTDLLNRQVPNEYVRAPAKESFMDWAAPLMLMAPAIGGIVSGAMGGAFSGASGATAAGTAPTQVGGWSWSDPSITQGGGMDWLNTDWGTEGLVDSSWTTDPRFNGTTVDFTTTRVGSGVNMNDYYSMLDEIQAGTNGVTAPSPTMSVPGYGDVYGSPSTILKSLVGSGMSPTIAMSMLQKALGGDTSALSALGGALGGSGSNSIWDMFTKLLPAGLGMYASNQQANKLSELAQKYQDYGAPYRQQLADISANPDNFYNSLGAQKATDAVLNKLSIGGNPAGSANKQALTIDSLYDQYGKERDRLAGFGGLTNYNQAAPNLEAQAIGANANMWNAAGAGLNDIFNPKTSLADLLKQGKIV